MRPPKGAALITYNCTGSADPPCSVSAEGIVVSHVTGACPDATAHGTAPAI